MVLPTHTPTVIYDNFVCVIDKDTYNSRDLVYRNNKNVLMVLIFFTAAVEWEARIEKSHEETKNLIKRYEDKLSQNQVHC